jgi:hypothetical protein
MIRPCAADDFAAIRARMEELRSERAEASAETEPRSVGPRPYYRASNAIAPQDRRHRPPHLIRMHRVRLFESSAACSPKHVIGLA